MHKVGTHMYTMPIMKPMLCVFVCVCVCSVRHSHYHHLNQLVGGYGQYVWSIAISPHNQEI